MEQTIIDGFRVMIFTGFDGTQLFINHPDGHNIYAHRVAGDAMERAKVIIAANTLIASDEPAKDDRMICINVRRAEFSDAIVRGKNSRLEVFEDWDKDAFVVVNSDNKAEYRVHLESRDGQLFCSCECPDFFYRKRVCKHVGEVLTHCLFSVGVKT
jgi:hypothetical protein